MFDDSDVCILGDPCWRVFSPIVYPLPVFYVEYMKDIEVLKHLKKTTWQWFWNINVHKNVLQILLKCRLGLFRCMWGLRLCITTNKVPGDINTSPPTTNTLNSKDIAQIKYSYLNTPPFKIPNIFCPFPFFWEFWHTNIYNQLNVINAKKIKSRSPLLAYSTSPLWNISLSWSSAVKLGNIMGGCYQE